jgi:vacuolar-type H+-ATPase subunit E/Vma4
MSLSDLRSQIKEEAHKTADEIRQKARLEAAAATESARVEADRKIESALESATAQLAEEESEGRTSAALEAKKMVSEAREAAVAGALEEIKNIMAEARASGSSYAALLRRLAEKGCDELGTRKVRVLANRNDHKYLKGYCLEHADIQGGVIVETSDGKVRSDKSFDAIFSQRKDEMRRQLYAMMFREAKPASTAAKKNAGSRRNGKKRKKK